MTQAKQFRQFSILSPAVAVMNRLNFASKFTLISVLFLAPIALLTFVLYSQLQRDIEQTARIQGGVDAFESVSKILQRQGVYRDHSIILLAQDLPELKPIIDNNREAVQQEMDVLYEKVQQGQAGILDQERFDRLMKAWESAQNSGGGRSVVDYYLNFNQLSNELRLLNTYVIENSGMAGETDPVVKQWLDMITKYIPALLDTYGKARAYGNYALNTNYLDGATYESVDSALVAFMDQQKSLDVFLTSLLEKPESAPLASHAEAVQQGLKETLTLLETHIVMANVLEYPWEEYDQQLTDHINQLLHFREALLTLVDQNIAQRLQEKQQYNLLLFSSLALLLALITYLYLGLFKSLRDNIADLSLSAKAMASGDLTTRVETSGRDEMAALSETFNSMVQHVNQLIMSVKQGATEATTQAQGVRENAGRTDSAVQQQLQRTEQIVTAVAELADTAQDVSQQSNAQADSARAANKAALEGQHLVDTAIGGFDQLTAKINDSRNVIDRLSKQSQGVTQILEVIKGVADQTNLLALNAAIEAARAGDQGRGFAVVADEVRALAQKTHGAAVEIGDVLHSIRDGVDESVGAMTDCENVTEETVANAKAISSKLASILDTVREISAGAEHIDHSTQSQAQLVEDINDHVHSISKISHQTKHTAEQTNESSSRMTKVAESLSELVERFKV